MYIWALAEKKTRQSSLPLLPPLAFALIFSLFGKRKFRPHLISRRIQPSWRRLTCSLLHLFLRLLYVDPLMIYRVFVLRATQTPFSMHFYALHNAFASEIYLLFHCIIKSFFFLPLLRHLCTRLLDFLC